MLRAWAAVACKTRPDSHGWAHCNSVVRCHIVAEHDIKVVSGQEVHYIQEAVQHAVIWQVAVASARDHSSCRGVQCRNAPPRGTGDIRIGDTALQLSCCWQCAVNDEVQRLQPGQIVETERDLDHVEAQRQDALHLSLEILAEAAGAVKQAIKHGVAIVKAGPGYTDQINSKA